jgi:hypothetical protein
MNEWDDLRRIADELQLKIHLAGMEARDRWRALEPRLTELQRALARSGQKASEAIDRELTSVGSALEHGLLPESPPRPGLTHEA